MRKVFVFKNIEVSGAKVSHALAIGLPSLTALTGLAGAFASSLAVAAGLSPLDLRDAGVALAFENYHLHEGYKKATDSKKSDIASRALAAVYASFTAHLIIEVEGATPAANEALANLDLTDDARDTLQGLRLCGASLMGATRPLRLNAQKVQELGSERKAAFAMLPSKARVVVDSSHFVAGMRAQGLNLMAGLLAATMPHKTRPAPFKEFFEEACGGHQHVLGVVHNGYMLLGETGAHAFRPTYQGEYLPVQAGSPTLTLVRLQSAASLRSAPEEDGASPTDFAFWKTHRHVGGYLCQPSA